MLPVERVISDDGASFWEPADNAWQPLWLAQDRVATLARDLGFGSHPPTLLGNGYMNQTWLTGSTHQRRVLRVGRAERTLEQAEYESRLLTAWSSAVPAIVPLEQLVCDEARTAGRVVGVFPFREGVSGTGVPAAVRAEQVAPAMAAMHRVSLGLGVGQRNDVPGLSDAPVAPLWDRVLSAVHQRFPQSQMVTTLEATISRAVHEVDQQVLAAGRSGRLGPFAPLHGDLNARNQIYHDGTLVGLIDADDCRVDSLVGEIANLAYSDPHQVAPTKVWQLYQAAGGPLPAGDEDLLLTLARHATLHELQWCITDSGHAHPRALDMLADVAHDLPLPTRG